MQHDKDIAKRVAKDMLYAEALAATIKELGSVPSGKLYANVMNHMDFTTYERLIGVLVTIGIIKRSDSHVLTWAGK